MLARFRRVRRRRLTLTTHPSHRSAESVASTTPPVPLFFPSLDPVRGAGVEPALQAWKASVIPLDYPRSAGVLDRRYLSPSSGHAFGRLEPSLRSASSSSIAARRSCTSSPSFSRSRAIRRAFGIVCFVSHSRVSFRSFVGFGRSTPLRAIVPSCLTIVSPKSCRAYLARLSQRNTGVDEWADCPRRGPLAISISHPLSMSATCPTRPWIDRAPRDGMIGMALFQGLLDREGRVLDKANRFVNSGNAALDADAPQRAAIAFVKALEILEAQEPAARIEDFQEAYATVGSALLRVGRMESAQSAATHALAANGGSLRALGLQGDILLAQERASDALGYYDAGLRIDPKAKDLWERKGDAHVALEQRPEAIRAYMQVVNLDPDDAEGYRRVLSLVPDDADLWVRAGNAHRRKSELDEAQSAFDRALRINSESKEALEGKAQAYLAGGDSPRAVRCLDRVTQLDPYDPDAWRLRGDVLGTPARCTRKLTRASS